jgi:MinD-like ATPase involved in chromosome partitioning or flagellar assembly
VDLPTYTNIWRIEKRLYKLYDFRLPAPVPITWIAVFSGITVPYVVFLVAIGLPFNHNLVWLYVLPPGVLTWLCTRPVIENKRLPELVGSQLRYLSEPRSWCRMVPASEKGEIQVSVRVWRRYPPKPKARRRPARKDKRQQVRPSAPAHTRPHVIVPSAEEVMGLAATAEVSSPAMGPDMFVPQRATAQSLPQRATAQPPVSTGERPPRPWPQAATAAPAWKSRPAPVLRPLPATGWEPRPAPFLAQPPESLGQPPELREPREPQESRELQEPREPQEAPDPTTAEPPAAMAPTPEEPCIPQVPQRREPEPDRAPPTPPEAATETPAGTPTAFELAHDAQPADWYATPDQDLPSWSGPPQPAQAPQRSQRAQLPHRPPVGIPPQPPATAPKAKVVDLDAERPLPSIERAISAPDAPRDQGWRRRVKVVAGGQGPGKRDQESLDRDRARLPLAPPSRWVVMLGCTGGAGQTTTTLLTGRLLAQLRRHPVAAITAASGKPQGATINTVLSGRIPPGKGFDVIADDGSAQAEDYQRLATILGDRYPLTVVDPAAAEMTRVLSLADQLVIVVPGTAEAASSLANTQQWLDAHGYSDLAQRAVTLVNGVRKDMMSDVLRAESVARGRCRAIVRVPWDDLMAGPQPLAPQTRLAFTALAGVLVAGLAATSGKESR